MLFSDLKHASNKHLSGTSPTADFVLWCANGTFPSGEAEVKDAKKGIRAKLLGFYQWIGLRENLQETI